MITKKQTVKQEACVIYNSDDKRYFISSGNVASRIPWFTYVGKTTIEFEVPEGVDLIANAVEELKAEKAELTAKHHMEIVKLDDKIASLMCIEND